KARESDWASVGYYDVAFWQELSNFACRNPEGTPSEMFWHEGSYFTVVGNPEKWWMQEKWLRKALNYAVDVENIMSACYEGMAAPDPPTYLHPDNPNYDELVNKQVVQETWSLLETGYNGHQYIKNSDEKAIEILQEHCEGSVEEGWTYEGKELGGWTIQAVNGWGDVMSLVKSVAKDWREIGIPCEPEFPDYGGWTTNWDTMNFDWMQLWGICPLVGSTVASGYDRTFIGPHTNIWVGNGFYKYEVYFTEDYEAWPNTASEVEQLVLDLYGMEAMTDEYVSTVKELQSIIVPQVPCVFTVSKSTPEGQLLDRWVNYPTVADPYEHRQNLCAPHFYLKHTYPRDISTVGFSLSSKTVEPGDSVTAEVSLMNSADVDLNYAVYVRNGAPKAGPGPEVLAHKGVSVPGGETVTVELELTAPDTEGDYTLTVGDWRIDKYDPGDPKTKVLEVTTEVPVSPIENIPENIGPKLDMAISTAQQALTSAQDAKASADSAVDAAEAAESAANDAKAAADDATAAAEEAGGASTTMVVASMIITIIVVLIGVYAITSKQG
ncbi:hypothetical protein AKJ63_01255, partial [candidate division MSBL1 archaeon SCGC-AAA259D18]